MEPGESYPRAVWSCRIRGNTRNIGSKGSPDPSSILPAELSNLTERRGVDRRVRRCRFASLRVKPFGRLRTAGHSMALRSPADVCSGRSLIYSATLSNVWLSAASQLPLLAQSCPPTVSPEGAASTKRCDGSQSRAGEHSARRRPRSQGRLQSRKVSLKAVAGHRRTWRNVALIPSTAA